MTKETRKAVRSFLRDYLIPPTCPGCGSLTPIENLHAPFCIECRGIWEEEKLSPCETCGLSMTDCVCLPRVLTENGIRDGIFLTAYRSGGGTAPDGLIYYIKSNLDGRAFDFLARELSVHVNRFVRMEEIPADRICFASLPRRKSAIRENGFDQAEVLARAIAAETGYPYRKLLFRSRAGREQKHLSREERRANTEGAFRYAKRGDPLDGMTVFLVDDVMTTGNGLYECAAVLYKNGAERVVPVVIAKTETAKKRT